MIDYQINKSAKFLINKHGEMKYEGNILNLSKCDDMKLLLISTDTCLCKIYEFNDFLLLKNKSKYEIKHKFDLYKNNKKYLLTEPIFEINPYSEERLSVAIGMNQIVIVMLLGRKQSLLEINHKEECNCTFIQWEKDLLVCAFENNIIKIKKY